MKTQKLNQLMYNYIINAINGEVYEKELTTEVEKLSFLKETFKHEYCFSDNLKRYKTEQNVFTEWIMGLPSVFNVDFENYAIIQLLKSWGVLSENSTDKSIDYHLSRWFSCVSSETFDIFRKHNIQ